MRQTWRKKYGVGRQHKYLHPKIYSKTRANKPKKKIIIPKFVWLALVVVSFIGGLSWFVFGSDYFFGVYRFKNGFEFCPAQSHVSARRRLFEVAVGHHVGIGVRRECQQGQAKPSTKECNAPAQNR